jgi:hypothetical protein
MFFAQSFYRGLLEAFIDITPTHSTLIRMDLNLLKEGWIIVVKASFLILRWFLVRRLASCL